MRSVREQEIPPDDPAAAYRLLTAVVAPRPIAWVSTIDVDGRANLAPFSWFNVVATAPPVLSIAVGQPSDRPAKDTLANVRATGELVVHVADASLAEAVNASAGNHPPGVDEFDVAGLARTPSVVVAPPRVAAAPVALECVLEREVAIGSGRGSSTLLLVRLVHAAVAEDLLDDEGRVDVARLQPLARLAGNDFTVPGERITLVRPRL